MAVRKINESTLTAIADAIRSKTGGSALIDPEDMADAILSISGGGGEGLPSEYQEVEYIQTSGSQFIQTGCYPHYDSRIVLDWELVDAIKGANSTPMGTTDGTGTQTGSWQIRCQGYVEFGNSKGNVGVVPNGLIDMRYGNVILNGVAHQVSTSAFTTPHHSLVVGGLLTGGALNQNATIAMKIKEFYAYDSVSDELPAFHLIPCYRKSDGVIGMYDLVGRTFKVNGGTGVFLKGADVN